MSIGKPMSLPSCVVPFLSFQVRYSEVTFEAPSVLRSTNLDACGRNAAMSSPLTPVMSGTNLPLAIVVVSLALKSPPITDGLSVVCVKCLTPSATTLSLRPPAQYHRVVVLLSVEPDPEPESSPHAVSATPAAENMPSCSRCRRESSTESSCAFRGCEPSFPGEHRVWV